MKPIPTLLLIADRGHFLAYRTRESGPPELLERVDIPEGILRLSEQLTDRAGAFPSLESNGQGTSAAERMSIPAELEARSVRRIAQEIEARVANWPGLWGLAAPATINRAILAELRQATVDRLSINVKRDLTRIPAADIPGHFARTRDEGG